MRLLIPFIGFLYLVGATNGHVPWLWVGVLAIALFAEAVHARRRKRS